MLFLLFGVFRFVSCNKKIEESLSTRGSNWLTKSQLGVYVACKVVFMPYLTAPSAGKIINKQRGALVIKRCSYFI